MAKSEKLFFEWIKSSPKHEVTWTGMPEGQEYYCDYMEDAIRTAMALAMEYGHAELTCKRPLYRKLYFDRMPQNKVRVVVM